VTSYTFTVLTKRAGSAHYTTTVTVTVPAGATTGTVSVTNCGCIDEVDETFTIAMELWLLVQLST
jgi:hypothetical protein